MSIFTRQRTAQRLLFMSTLACVAALSACDEKEDLTRTHYDNPFAEAKRWYVNPMWTKQARADGGEAIANESSAIWLNRTSDVKAFQGQEPRNGMGLREHLDAAIEQQADLFTFVMYNLPGKGCGELYGDVTPTERQDFYSNKPSQANMDIYKKEYIGEIVKILGDEKYAGISVVAILEPDTLINLVTDFLDSQCMESANDKAWGHTEGVRYTLTQLGTLNNVHTYIDAGNSAILGWGEELAFATMFMKGVLTGFEGLATQAQTLGNKFEDLDGASGKFTQIGLAFAESAGVTPPPGWGSIDGFITNTANYIPLTEPYLSAFSADGSFETSAYTTPFYDWNPILGELNYSREWHDAMQAHGADDSLGMLIDTSRNGWGGDNRPTPPPGLDLELEYPNPDERVEAFRIDRREHRRSFCNQEGAGIGERPQANPSQHIDAYIWAKPVGESDGISIYDVLFDPKAPSHRHEAICEPDGYNRFAEDNFATSDLELGTGAMEDAPHYGEWFSYAFKQLLENAPPPIQKLDE